MDCVSRRQLRTRGIDLFLDIQWGQYLQKEV